MTQGSTCLSGCACCTPAMPAGGWHQDNHHKLHATGASGTAPGAGNTAKDSIPDIAKLGRYVIKGGCVVTMDRAIGDFEVADILVDAGRIQAVEPEIKSDLPVLDATGMVLCPGFVDTHRHCWQNMFRRFAPNATVTEYRKSSNAIADVVRPEDVYAGTLISCWGALDYGVTTLVDWSHISNTPEHSDAIVEALRETRIRAIYGYAHARSNFPASQYPHDLARLKKQYFSSEDQLVQLFLGADIERAHLWPMARDLGVRITSHAWRQTREVEAAGRAGLLANDVTLIHCTALSADAWSMMADSGVSISLAPNTVMQLGVGAGISPVQTALDHGIRPSLSIDTETVLPGDMLNQMRILLSVQRGAANQRRFDGESDIPELLSVRDVLEFATIRGAVACGLGEKVGTLTPGKQADIIMIRANDPNLIPLNNAIGTIVSGADRGNIDTVIVAGRVLKRGGRLLAYDQTRMSRLVYHARDWIAERSGIQPDILGPGCGSGLAIEDVSRNDLASRT